MKRKKEMESLEILSHKHDFPIEYMWNTDTIITRLIVPRLKTFRFLEKHGYPGHIDSIDAWHKIINKMIYAIKLSTCTFLCSLLDKRRGLKTVLMRFTGLRYGYKTHF